MTDDDPALRELGARIDDLETAVRDLRHTVSELGRRLALDLPQILSRHRDAIVAALAPAVAAEPERGSGETGLAQAAPGDPGNPGDTDSSGLGQPAPSTDQSARAGAAAADREDGTTDGSAAPSRRTLRRRRGSAAAGS